MIRLRWVRVKTGSPVTRVTTFCANREPGGYPPSCAVTPRWIARILLH
jgi:hypothetical protein